VNNHFNSSLINAAGEEGVGGETRILGVEYKPYTGKKKARFPRRFKAVFWKE
jgi:hypothetical protein